MDGEIRSLEREEREGGVVGRQISQREKQIKHRDREGGDCFLLSNEKALAL